ncbi:MAG: response regulator [Candidatus Brennerbacteria bacterium]|nr:response regulator [Candidatus Brennerbacteria bacterium]
MNNSHKILIIEDDRGIRRALEFLLKKNGYRVFSAADGTNAIQIIFDEKPDLIILDLMIPEISGFKIMQKIKENEKTCNAKIFIFTNLSDEKDKRMAKKLGADGYFVKAEISINEIIKKINQVFETNVLLTNDKKENII